MRLAIKEKIHRHETQFGPPDLAEYKKRKMMQALAEHLVRNIDGLISEQADGEGGITLFCQIDFMSELEQERIRRHAQEDAMCIVMEHQPRIVDDFGNQVQSVSLAQKLHDRFRGKK